MKIYKDESLRGFEFWSGAVDNAEEFTLEELDQITDVLEALDNGEGYDETDINDMMWFDAETVYEWLGIGNEEDNENE